MSFFLSLYNIYIYTYLCIILYIWAWAINWKLSRSREGKFSLMSGGIRRSRAWLFLNFGRSRKFRWMTYRLETFMQRAFFEFTFHVAKNYHAAICNTCAQKTASTRPLADPTDFNGWGHFPLQVASWCFQEQFTKMSRRFGPHPDKPRQPGGTNIWKVNLPSNVTGWYKRLQTHWG